MAKLVRVSLTPLEADLVHWSLLVARQDQEGREDSASYFSRSRNYQVVIEKVVKAKRRSAL